MKERPILFSGPMVRAILAGEKTQTRRVVKNKNFSSWINAGFTDEFIKLPENLWHESCPYGQPGDRLWVRETWANLFGLTDGNLSGVIYRADGTGRYGNEDEYLDTSSDEMKWKPSIFMPRWASRINLEITNVRVERLQDITEEAAVSEGVKYYIASGKKQSPEMSMVAQFSELWNSINEKRGYGWDASPFVWVVEFEQL